MDDELKMRAIGHLNAVMDTAGTQAAVLTIQALAEQLGVTHVKGLPVLEYYDQTRDRLVDEKLPKLADLDMGTVSAMKQLWDDILKNRP